MRKSKEVRRAEFKKALIDRLKSLIAPMIVLALVVGVIIFIGNSSLFISVLPSKTIVSLQGK